MGRIPEDIIEQVLAATDITSLIGSKVALSKVGSRYRGLCPFHNEKTPSFYVDPNRQRYHCFGCGANGSAAGWLMNYENRSFVEAIQMLAKDAGIPLENTKETPQQAAARKQKEAALSALAAACQHWKKMLWESPSANTARTYLEQRGIDASTAENWEFGYAEANSAEFLRWAKTQNLKGRALVDAGLTSLKEENNARSGLYSRFRDRLMFPIRDITGKIVGFSGRVLDNKSKTAKYINTPETAYFHKGSLLFGADKARQAIIQKKRAILCEGQLDCIALHKAGFTESVAPLGTATTPEHGKQLKRITDHVILLFDADTAGQKAAIRAAETLLTLDIKTRVAQLPQGEDPDSFLAKNGAEALTELLTQSREFFDHLRTYYAQQYSLQTAEGSQQFAEKMSEALALMKDPIAQEAQILQVAASLHVPDKEIRRRIQKIKTATARRKALPQIKPNSTNPEEPQKAKPPSFSAPETPLLQHFCLLFLLPESRAILLAHKADLLGYLKELLVTGLPVQLLQLHLPAPEETNIHHIYAQVSPPEKQWLEQEFSTSPLQNSAEEQQQKLAKEALLRIEQTTLQRRLAQGASKLKGSQLPSLEILALQKELVTYRNRLAEMESSSLLN